jgi:hypothetical protein
MPRLRSRDHDFLMMLIALLTGSICLYSAIVLFNSALASHRIYSDEIIADQSMRFMASCSFSPHPQCRRIRQPPFWSCLLYWAQIHHHRYEYVQSAVTRVNLEGMGNLRGLHSALSTMRMLRKSLLNVMVLSTPRNGCASCKSLCASFTRLEPARNLCTIKATLNYRCSIFNHDQNTNSQMIEWSSTAFTRYISTSAPGSCQIQAF